MLAAVLALTLTAGVAVGCGDDDNDDGTTTGAATTGATGATGTTGAESGSNAATVKMKDFAFVPADLTVSAGTVKITAPNIGKAVHELVVIKTNEDPGSLPTDSAGEVEEDNLDVVGEIADVDPGKTKKGSFDLKAGKYAMVCNVPGHYKAGMYGSLTAD